MQFVSRFLLLALVPAIVVACGDEKADEATTAADETATQTESLANTAAFAHTAFALDAAKSENGAPGARPTSPEGWATAVKERLGRTVTCGRAEPKGLKAVTLNLPGSCAVHGRFVSGTVEFAYDADGEGRPRATITFSGVGARGGAAGGTIVVVRTGDGAYNVDWTWSGVGFRGRQFSGKYDGTVSVAGETIVISGRHQWSWASVRAQREASLTTTGLTFVKGARIPKAGTVSYQNSAGRNFTIVFSADASGDVAAVVTNAAGQSKTVVLGT